MTVPRWRLSIEHLMACNCNYGCPCSFEAPPTFGSCEASGAFRIARGDYGGLSLDGLVWAHASLWPGPLHERNGRSIIYLDAQATPEQRAALAEIAGGRAGGPIGVFMSTVTAGIEVRVAPIEFHFAGKDSWYRVGDEVEVALEAIRNPVTGEEHQAAALLPNGMMTTKEDFYATRRFRVRAGDFDFDYPARNALAFAHTWAGP